MKIKNISIKKRKEMIAVVFLVLILVLGVFFVFAQSGVSIKTKCEYSSECALSSSEVEESKSETFICRECNKCNPLSVGCIPNLLDNGKACGESSNYMCLNGECIPKENCYCNYLSQLTGKKYVPYLENSENPVYSQGSGTGTGSGITPITAAAITGAAVKSITGFAAAESTKEIMIMVFVADSCPPCERIIKSSVLQQIDNYMIPGFDKKVKVQIYHQKNHQTFFRQYGVKMTPTTIILNNGKLIVDNQGNPFSKIGEYAPSNLYDINNKEKMREYIRQSLVYIQNIVDPLLREVEVINEAGTEITIECEKNGENKNKITIKNTEQYALVFKINADNSLKISPYSFFTLNSGKEGTFEVKYLGECPKEEKTITITSLRGPFTKESADSMGSPRYLAEIKIKIIPKKASGDVNCVAGKETIIERYCSGNAVHEKFSVQEGVMCILKSRKIIDCTTNQVCKESVKDGKKDASCVKKGEETPGDEWELVDDGKPGSEEEKPLPTPGPEPTPTPQPEPSPEPEQTPQPQPTPTPTPQPTPQPSPTPSPSPSPSPSPGEEKAACIEEKPKESKPGQLSTPPKKQEFVSVLSNPKYSDGGEGSASGEDKGYKTANANLFLEKNAFKEILEKSNTIGDFYKNILSSNIPMAITANIVFGTGGTWGESWKGNLKTKDIYDSFIEQYNDLAFASQGKYRKTKKSGYENMPQNLKDHNKNLYPLTRNDYDNFAGLLNSVLSKTGEFPPGTQITIVTGPCNPYVEIKVPGKTPIKQAIAQGQIESFFKFYYNSIMVRDPSPSGLRRDDGAVESTIDRLFRNKQNYLNQLSK